MDFDVLILGSGAGGGMTALSLCEQGFKVGLIERGPRFDPQKDFILNYPDWETRRDPLQTARLQEQTINQKYKINIAADGSQHQRASLVYHRVYGLGGSTLHYQGEAHRFAEHAFNTRQQFGWGVDWPINYQDLAPFYRKTEQLLGVAGDTNNPFKPEREAFHTAAHELSQRSQLLAKSARQAGMTLLPNTLALPSASVDGRLPCQHSGGCNFGCVFGAKSSIDQAIIPRAEKTGNLTILTDTRALRLVLDENGEITAVDCRGQAGDLQLKARAYVLASGAVETPRLMLNSRTTAAPTGFGNRNDQVGRYFMETVMAYLSLKLSAEFKTYRGPPLDSRIWDFARPGDDRTNGFVLGSSGFLYPSTGPAGYAMRTPGIGRAHKALVRRGFGRNLLLFGIAEQTPMASNRVSLSKSRDKAGVPKVDVNCAYAERDLHTLDVMKGKLRQWARATPTETTGKVADTRQHSAATHVGGTCRMGDDPATSVVDAFGRVHDKSNCYITDASVLPTQGAGDSPSLTIQALALRTAERIAADLKS